MRGLRERSHGVNPNKYFLQNLSVFAIKFGRFMEDTIFFICYKHSSLTVRIGKRVIKKFSKIDSQSLFWTLRPGGS